MSDPRYSDPRYSDMWNRNAMLNDEGTTGARGAFAISVGTTVLLAAVIIVGLYFKPNRDAASSHRAPVTIHNMPMMSPNVIGSGSTRPQPLTPPSRNQR